MKKLPELLCPAGSPEALDAAIEGGADAVYFGGAQFNARMNAKNFGGDALRSAVLRAHAFGVKTYLTLNTLVADRELSSFVEAAGEAWRAGIDAVIVADLGGAAAIHRAYPGLELHASTQMSGHSAQMGRELQRLGFSRMVIARETSLEDLRHIVEQSPIEVEYFIHGALCVSHSGQCLFSSLVGGRSGNRGECAQPCRLPYGCAGCREKKGNGYPLSLKDLSLAAHVPALIESGVASLKIEGRMKSPEYVRDTARIWRSLLDGRRGATRGEMEQLAGAFSRGGFTDGYFTGNIGRAMLGIRSEADKESSRQSAPFEGLTKKIPLAISFWMGRDEPIRLTLENGGHRVTVCGDVPQPAINAPLTRETVERNLTKLGGTVYAVGSFFAEMEEGLMLPISRLNDLRRRALAAWEGESSSVRREEDADYQPQMPRGRKAPLREARFYDPEQITPSAKAYFDVIYLPLHRHVTGVRGVVLPPVIFDSDLATVEEQLKNAALNGAEYALVGNLGHVDTVRRHGLTPVGDFRLNVTNGETVARLEELGVERVILSPELTLPRIRDLHGNTSVIVYGRIPLMTLEKCVIRELADCDACRGNKVQILDRRGAKFPVLREWQHRNVIYNSLPTCMSDRADVLRHAGVTAQHMIFSTETPREVDRVIRAFERGEPLGGQVRRLT